MCTAITYYTKDHYFGRNFDLEYSYLETVTITPRNYPFKFRRVKELKSHYAIIGVAFVAEGYPLYYDAINEKGLGMAGLNFPENADYKEIEDGKDNVGSFEFIPWILSQCATVAQAKTLLKRLNLAKIDFTDKLKASPLHWIIADKKSAITVECVKEGLKVYDNEVGVLTNNPPFDYQMTNLANYMSLSIEPPKNNFGKKLKLGRYSRGMGAMGLPGDLSSASRFVKAAFTKMHSVSGDTEEESVSQFFHILGSVEQQRGLVHMGNGEFEITIYGSCCNLDKGIYYYRTYDNGQISAINMFKENLDGEELINFDLVKGLHVNMQN